MVSMTIFQSIESQYQCEVWIWFFFRIPKFSGPLPLPHWRIFPGAGVTLFQGTDTKKVRKLVLSDHLNIPSYLVNWIKGSNFVCAGTRWPLLSYLLSLFSMGRNPHLHFLQGMEAHSSMHKSIPWPKVFKCKQTLIWSNKPSVKLENPSKITGHCSKPNKIFVRPQKPSQINLASQYKSSKTLTDLQGVVTRAGEPVLSDSLGLICPRPKQFFFLKKKHADRLGM